MIHDGYLFSHDLDWAERIPSSNLIQLALTRAGAADHWKYRILDYLFLLLAAPFVLPTLAVIAIWVKLEDPSSPVFYSQTRYGKNGTPFQILKVRTMVRGADQIKQTLLVQSEDKGPGFKLDNDPRITRPGRILRKLYLDELAQLWNVARGEMAIVGPRANSCNPAELEAWQRLRLLVRPGITGSWQVMRNKPRDFNERSLIDLDYIGRKSLAYDFAILLRTILIVFVRPTGC